MPLAPGTVAPNFVLTGFDGKELTLESLKGKKVYLCLFRVAACPLCNLQVSKIKKAASELSKNGLEIVCVFESTMAEMKSYSGTQASSDFAIYVDERKHAVYKDYQRKRGCAGTLIGYASCWHMCVDCKMWSAIPYMFKGCPPAVCNPMLYTPRGVMGMPADFLIDEQGKIVDVHYGHVIGDHMSMDKVEAFAGVAGGTPPSDLMERA